MKNLKPFQRLSQKMTAISALFLSLMSGCSENNPLGQVRESTGLSERRLINPSELWVLPKDASFALGGRLDGDNYQLIGLENLSNMEGDNFLLLISKGSKSQKRQNFDPIKPLQNLKLSTAPFYDLGDSQLRQKTLGAGKVFWKENGTGGKVNCVLGFRRITEEQVSLPRNIFALEMILRNCVRGSYDSALNPILDRGLYVSMNSLPSNKPSSPLWISPLAGPKKF